MDNHQPATRITGNNAKGSKRRIGKSKRSSLAPEEDGPRKRKTAPVDRQVVAEESSLLPTLPGASALFQSQRAGVKGIRGKIREAETSGEVLAISQQQFDSFLALASTQDPNRPFIEQLYQRQSKELHRLSWLLLCNHNILLYGVGSKTHLLHELVQNYLLGEDVIEIKLPNVSSTASTVINAEQAIKSIMAHIETVVLMHRITEECTQHLPHRAALLADMLDIHYGRGGKIAPTALPSSPQTASSASNCATTNATTSIAITSAAAANVRNRPSRSRVDDTERWGGRYAQAQSHLYLIIHDIAGPVLSDPVCQRCLAILAQCASVSVVATVGNLNSVVHWERGLLAQYGWVYQHVPTFARHPIPVGTFPLVLKPTSVEVPLGLLGAAAAGVEEDVEGEAGDEHGDGSEQAATKSAAQASITNSTATAATATHVAQARAAGAKITAITISSSTAATALAAHSMAAINNSLTNKHTTALTTLIQAIRTKVRRAAEEQSGADGGPGGSGSGTGSGGSSRPVRAAGAAAKRALAQHHDALSHHYGITIADLYDLLRVGLTVKSHRDLHHLLKEYIDHGVLAKIVHQGQEYVCLKPPYDCYKDGEARGVGVL